MSAGGRTPPRKFPTIARIAEAAGVGTATVDRVLNGRSGVSDRTRQAVTEALSKLSRELSGDLAELDIRLFCDSGEAFNAAMKVAETAVNRAMPSIAIRGTYVRTSETDPADFASELKRDGRAADGVLVVAREHPATNRAIGELCREGTPVICLTTDLPSSGRTAYVGNDQYAAGCVAAQLVGTALSDRERRILIIMSVPFRCQQEREMGFRRVLRADFPLLRIDERVISDDVPDHTCRQLRRHFETHGVPDAIYNVAGANRGVAEALERVEGGTACMFVGHELTPNSRRLLESGTMDYVISHDFVGEVTEAVRCIRDSRCGPIAYPGHSDILVHTRYNCA